MIKKILFAVLFLLSFASAHGDYPNVDNNYIFKEKIIQTNYFPDEHLVLSQTTYIDYNNDKRFPTYDYRYGYTYRSSVDYRDRYYEKKNVLKYSRSYSHRHYDVKDYYYRYIPYLKTYEKRECYNVAPRGKLFYIKCP